MKDIFFSRYDAAFLNQYTAYHGDLDDSSLTCRQAFHVFHCSRRAVCHKQHYLHFDVDLAP